MSEWCVAAPIMFTLLRAGTVAALDEMIDGPAGRYAAGPAPSWSMGQEGGGRTGDERTQDGQAGLEVCDHAAVYSEELFQLVAVFGQIQDGRCLVGLIERVQLIAKALRPGFQSRAGGPIGQGDKGRASAPEDQHGLRRQLGRSAVGVQALLQRERCAECQG